MNGNRSNQISRKNASEINILSVTSDIQHGQGSQDAIKLCAKNGALMRRVKRGKIGQAKSVFFVNGNRQFQYHTLGYSKIISPRQKTVEVDQLVEVCIGFGTDQLQKASERISFRRIAPEEYCISVIVRQYGKNKRRMIDFIAANSRDKEVFADALRCIIGEKETKLMEFNEKQWIIDKFYATDVKSNSSRKDGTLSANDLKNFLIYKQKFKGIDNNIATSIINEIIIKLGTYRIEKPANLLGPFDFRYLLRSRWGNILKCGHENIFQELDQPLSHYYINSSHNIYLVGTQINGEAIIEGYINAIRKGARLLESWIYLVDVLDGAHGEPCIRHRGTLITSRYLKDALTVIKNYAFRYTPYPLILTIENYCSLEQQQIMARNFVEVLDNNIYLTPKNESLIRLPSPNQLKYKYLLRGKIGSVISKRYVNSKYDKDDKVAETELLVHPELSRLISIIHVKSSNNLRDDKHSANCSISISETKIRKLMEISETFTVYTSKHFVKSYPKGLRQNSSNFCPIQSWIFGIQSVSLNMQTNGKELDLNSGLFRINGNCGYVLKPPILIRGL
ncbi:unnamed protein product, partial [Acanthocheilonema viteae]